MSFRQFLRLVNKGFNPLDGRSKLLRLTANQAYHPQLRSVSDVIGHVGSAQTQFRPRLASILSPMTSLNHKFGAAGTGWGFSRYFAKPAADDVVNLEQQKSSQKKKKMRVTPAAAESEKSSIKSKVVAKTNAENVIPAAQSSQLKNISDAKKKSRRSENKAKPVVVEEEGSKASSQTEKLTKRVSKEKVNGNSLESLASSSGKKSNNKTKNSIEHGKSTDQIKILANMNIGGAKHGLNEIIHSQQLSSIGQSKHQSQPPLFPPSGKSVVVVESLTKAKIIQGYLGDMYEVLASHGHVRDLAARSGSVRPDDDFSMLWEVPSAAWTHVKRIKVALNGAKNLILASDPDREGEAIAWHIVEMLIQQDALDSGIRVARVAFNEITEASIKNSLEAPRDIDQNLVNAFLAQRALEYLTQFNISPLLWKKLPGCHSAGRVQSSALSLICDREMEIDRFNPQEFWTVDAVFSYNQSSSSRNAFTFSSHLTQIGSRKLSQSTISSETETKDIEQRLAITTRKSKKKTWTSSRDRHLTPVNFQVVSSKKSQIRENPPSPFISSTLQQDAADSLGFPATLTMKLAEKLYEGVQLADGKSTGLITYTKTDELHISDEAIIDICSLINQRYGPDFTSDEARKYSTKVKTVQEAIRPTDIKRLPSSLIGILDEDALKLYTLIWCRTLACQMGPAVIDQIKLDIGSSDGFATFQASYSKTGFLGYQTVYQDVEAELISTKKKEETTESTSFSTVGVLKEGDQVRMSMVKMKQLHTVPPARYNEGSVIKKLEELGIGRPSTYAKTIKVLQDKRYIAVKSGVLHPEFRGRMVSAFIGNYFSEFADYKYSADVEAKIDKVSAGMTEWKCLLKDYWTKFSKHCKQASNVTIDKVEKMLEEKCGDFLFASLPNHDRSCPSCLGGTLVFKVNRVGAGYYIGCNQHPKCKYIAKTLYGGDDDEDNEDDETKLNTTHFVVEEPQLIGVHPSTGEKVFLKMGLYGYFVQLGEDKKFHSPQRASVAHIKDVTSISLEEALDLLSYPKMLGMHKDGKPVLIKIGTKGFSVKHGPFSAPIPKGMEPSQVTLEKAIKILTGPNVKRRGRKKDKPEVRI